ncbi:DNA ligase D [Xylophilus sp. GOD-11R]|uniref:DNA ligase D n=1 Tax=Xylophilus sp. GOD-11R TaxID=3089814 RepID=UPI00298C5CEA|nr:DNA ligase D [Xylophilus sp. GOD-11R]WPB57848.1 DNA ligase D [Xylophilus sp. GOD-11R]
MPPFDPQDFGSAAETGSLSMARDRTRAADTLERYRAKRDFSATPEPRGQRASDGDERIFVVQEHHASHLHYDFRLELDGTLKSWAVPKGPSLDPHVKRMAVQVEDHPLSYAGFEGTIPEKHYGAGTVIVWDAGTWQIDGDASAAYTKGRLKFSLAGQKLRGHWNLVRMKPREGERSPSWLLIKEDDAEARPEQDFDLLKERPGSVLGGAKARSAKTSATAKTKIKTKTKAKAKPVALPETLAPQLATLADALPPDRDAWAFEAKLDGYRLLVRSEAGTIRLFTRNGHDWTSKMRPLADALARLSLPDAWIDGEVVAAGPKGTPDFQALQRAFDGQDTAHLVYYAFDLPYCDRADLRASPLDERRERLAGLIGTATTGMVRFCQTLQGDPAELLQQACAFGFEGLIGKRRDGRYVSRRSPGWIKLKCGRRQEFVIGGFTDPRGSRSGLGALLLGYYDDGALRFAGSVGTGFDQATLDDLRGRLDAIATDRSAFADGTGVPRGAHFVEPRLVAEIAFGEWTRDGHLRHPVFHGLRVDKPARTIGREQAQEPMQTSRKTAAPSKSKAARTSATAANPLEGLRVTHGERVIDDKSGITKMDLLRYYASAAPLMLPHLADRPLAMLRSPEGVGGEAFFQKHAEARDIAGMRRLDPAFDPGHGALLVADDALALLSAVQMNAIEFHTWNAVVGQRAKPAKIALPDRLTFDLDPGDGVGWPQMREAAQLLHGFLDELGLVSFLKTSGGKGLHVVLPLKPKADWDTVKGFGQKVAQHMAAVIPARFVAKSGPRNRVGKIYIDYLRNGYGATTVSAWSVRARPGLGVSVPVGWDELPTVNGGDHWTVKTVEERLDIGNTPWDGYEAVAQSLDNAIGRLD